MPLTPVPSEEFPPLPEPLKHSPIYPDEPRDEQYSRARYVEGWNACVAEAKRLAADRAARAAESGVAIRLLAPQPAPLRGVVPGKVACAKCGFSLQRVTLYMGNGAVGPGGEEVEPCPNDGAPLLPVTWEQEVRECWTSLEQWCERAVAAEKLVAVGAEQEGRYATMIGDISEALGLTETEQFEANGADKILARIQALTTPRPEAAAQAERLTMPAKAAEARRLADEAKTWISQVVIAAHRRSPAQTQVTVEALEAFIDRLATLSADRAARSEAGEVDRG